MRDPKWIDIDGIRTRYFDSGSGIPILFLMGGNFGMPYSCSPCESWEKNFDPLSRKFRVIAFDKLGQGFTDNPKRDEDYTMGAVVEHAHGVMKALDLQNVHLVGNSRGGYLAARLTLLHAERVRSCTIINTSTLSPGVGLNEVWLAKPPHPPLSREGLRWVQERYATNLVEISEAALDRAYEVACLPKFQECVRKMEVEKLRTKVFVPDLAREKRETLTWIEERGMGRPTQVVWTTHDRTATLERGIQLFEMIARKEPQASFHVFNHAGHTPHQVHAERFNALLTSFIESVE